MGKAKRPMQVSHCSSGRSSAQVWSQSIRTIARTRREAAESVIGFRGADMGDTFFFFKWGEAQGLACCRHGSNRPAELDASASDA